MAGQVNATWRGDSNSERGRRERGVQSGEGRAKIETRTWIDILAGAMNWCPLVRIRSHSNAMLAWARADGVGKVI
jgi:hypothetical protein